MPRRSQRKRVKKNLLEFSEDCKAQCSQTGGEEKKLTNKKVFPSVGKEFCCYCGKEDSPLNKGEEEDTWIDCDICEKWWHGACAKLSDEDIQKFIVHDIKFPCAFCVVGKAGKELKEVSDKLDKQPVGPAGDGVTQVVSARCLMSLSGHLLRPVGISPPCFSFIRYILVLCL